MLIHGKNLSKEIEFATGLLLTGLMIFAVRAFIEKEWPFKSSEPSTSEQT